MYIHNIYLHYVSSFVVGKLLGKYRVMKAVYPYKVNNDRTDVQEFDPNLGEIAHFAAYYEYLFVAVSTQVYYCFYYSIHTCMSYVLL